MRTKTFLLFVFLLTGMAFSQQGGGERITLYKILELLALPDQEAVTLALEKDGYKNVCEGKYSKGAEVFTINRLSEFSVYYHEESPSKSRLREIQAFAYGEGFDVVKRGSSGWRMEKPGYSILADVGKDLIVKKLD